MPIVKITRQDEGFTPEPGKVRGHKAGYWFEWTGGIEPSPDEIKFKVLCQMLIDKGIITTADEDLIWTDGEYEFDKAEVFRRKEFNEKVNDERERRILEGCTVTVGAKAIPLDGRQQDLTNLQGLVTGAQLRVGQGDFTTITTFRDADNVLWSLTPLEVIGLWQGGAAFVSAVYQASWVIKDTTILDYTNDDHWPAPVWPQP